MSCLTSTAGTATYTLSSSTTAGLRSLADAVADGHVSDGDTVYYVALDTTTQGGALQFERGTGVVGSGGTTLTRNVTQSSNGDAKVVWGSGGSRTVHIILDAETFAILADTNTFTASGVAISLAGAANPALQISEGGAAADALTLTDVSTGQATVTKKTAASAAFLDLNASPGDGTSGANIRLFRDTNTTALKQLLFMAGNGTTTVVHTISSAGAAFTGSVTVGGTAVALQGVLDAPAGGVIMWGSTSVPSGWSLITTNVDDRAVILSNSAAQAGALGGTWTITGSTTVHGHALSVNELPSHQHAVGTNGFLDNLGGAGSFTLSPGTDWEVGFNTQTTGATAQHTHGATTTVGGGGTWRPLYRKMILIQKT